MGQNPYISCQSSQGPKLSVILGVTLKTFWNSEKL